MKIAGISFSCIEQDPNLRAINAEPIGLHSVLSFAEKESHSVKLFDINSSSNETTIKEINAYHPEIAAFSILTYQVYDAIKTARSLYENNNNILLIAGGAHPSADPDTLLKNGFHYCVIGEGEITFSQLLYQIANSKPINDLPGIAFLNNNIVYKTPPRTRIRKLDELPNPIRLEKYLRSKDIGIIFPPPSAQTGYAVIEYARGCKMDCAFCESSKFWQYLIQEKSPENVLCEIIKLYKDYNVNTIFFSDLNISHSKRKILNLCNLLIKENLPVYWKCESNIITMDEEILEAMQKAKCTRISWGIESGDIKTLKKINKIYDFQWCKHILSNSSSLGIINHGFYIIGFPWENEDSIYASYKKILCLDLHQIRIAIFTPFPNSRLYKELENDITADYFEKSNTSTLVYKHPNITKKNIIKIQKNLLHQFYYSKQYRDRIEKFIQNNPNLQSSFNEYFKFSGFSLKF